MNNYLEVRSLSKRFPGFVLDEITFSVPKGYIMGLVGPNGAGKTTVIYLILNMLKRHGGEIRVFGLDNVENEIQIKQAVGVVFDSLFFADTWNVQDTEKAISGFYQEWDSKGFHNLIDQFGLPLNKKLVDFSRGMKMKLMLATALSHNAKLLILDEPTSGLDAATRDQLSEILQDYIKDGEKSVLFSTHISSDLQRIADYITFLNDGKLFFTGSLQDLVDSHRMIKGRPDQLTKAVEEKLIGLRRTNVGFEGLIGVDDAAEFKTLLVDRASLDDIVIFAGKGKVKPV